jgi:chemotaxis regulatin CheY-phosphate phosphatase CheZ
MMRLNGQESDAAQLQAMIADARERLRYVTDPATRAAYRAAIRYACRARGIVELPERMKP